MKSSNPWTEIDIEIYEGHMSYDGVQQLQMLNAIYKEQIGTYSMPKIMILGSAGGNGLEHIDWDKTKKVYCIDINESYIETIKRRFTMGGIDCICEDLINLKQSLPHSDVVLANLLIEYIGVEKIKEVLDKVKPTIFSCVIQIEDTKGFVSISPYIDSMRVLEDLFIPVNKELLRQCIECLGYSITCEKLYILPNGKELMRIDYHRNLNS